MAVSSNHGAMPSRFVAALLRTRSLLVALCLLVLAPLAEAQSFTRCWLSRITGFDGHYSKADRLLHSPGIHTYTDESLAELKVYVGAETKAGDTALYLHTNFKPSNQDNPLKLAFPKETLDFAFADGEYDVSSLLGNVLAGEGVPDAVGKVRRNAVVILDQSAEDAFPSLRIGRVKSRQVLVGPATRPRPAIELVDAAGKLQRLSQIAPPPPEARVYLTGQLARAPANFTQLSRVKFNKKNISVHSLIADSDTQAALAKLPDGTLAPWSNSAAELSAAIKMNRDKHVFVIGHIDGNSLYFPGPDRHSIPLRDLETLAAEEKITLTIIGCGSGKTEAGVVATKEINSLHAAVNLVRAMEADNYLNFFTRFSSPDLEIVVNEHLVRKLSNGSSRLTSRSDLFTAGLSADGDTLRQADGAFVFTSEILPQ